MNINPGWLCVPINRVHIGSDNGLSPIRRQAIILTNAELLLFGPLGTDFNEILIKIKLFIHENASENTVCEMADILYRDRWVNDIRSKAIAAYYHQCYM